MGTHKPKWSDSVTQKLDALAAQYSEFRDGTPLLQQVKIVEICYDDIFDKQVGNLGAELTQLTGVLKTAGVALGKLTGWLKHATPTEQSFFWTHAVDVVLYRYVPNIRNSVRVQVMEQMVKAINQARAGGEVVEVSVLAHSLGTAVAVAALHLLSTTPFNGANAFMLGKDLTLMNVFTIANVSRVLRDDFDPYTCNVRPATAAASTYCARFYNFSHALDPFLRVNTFSPQAWGSAYSKTEPPLRHLHDFNVHGFDHYLDHPSVHIDVINGLFGSPVITAKDRLKAVTEYPALAGKCLPQLAGLGNELEKLSAATDIQQMLIRITQALAMGKLAAESCSAK